MEPTENPFRGQGTLKIVPALSLTQLQTRTRISLDSITADLLLYNGIKCCNAGARVKIDHMGMEK